MRTPSASSPALTALLVALPAAAQDGDLATPAFAEVGPAVLPGVETRSGAEDPQWIVEVNGGGLVTGDFDGDGRHDLVVVDGSTVERALAGEPGRPPRLFLQTPGGELAPAPEPWTLGGGRFGTGGTAADLEGDGDLDLVVTQWGPTRLVRNAGGAGFREAGAEAGLTGECWGTGAAFLDADLDGDLDLFVACYLELDTARVPPRASGACAWKGRPVVCGPEGLPPQPDRLYANRGDGTFVDATEAFGLVPRAAGYGLGVTTLDHDDDGDTDVYVANDSTANHLWDNVGGRFVEVGLRRGVATDASGKEQAGMGIAVGDVDGDGREDLFCTNFSGEANALYLSGGGGRYRERAAAVGVGGHGVPLLGWGTAALDVDLDADLDLVVLNGHVHAEADAPGTGTSYAQPDVLYEQRAPQAFVARALSPAPPAVSRTLAWLDLGGDGRLDLVASTLRGPVRVLANRAAPPDAHWLVVRLVDPGSRNRSALGARVTVALPAEEHQPERLLVREVRTAGGYQAGAPAEAHFGLGDAARVDVEVRWPDGERTRHTDLAVDRVVTLTRGAAEGER